MEYILHHVKHTNGYMNARLVFDEHILPLSRELTGANLLDFMLECNTKAKFTKALILPKIQFEYRNLLVKIQEGFSDQVDILEEGWQSWKKYYNMNQLLFSNVGLDPEICEEHQKLYDRMDEYSMDVRVSMTELVTEEITLLKLRYDTKPNVADEKIRRFNRFLLALNRNIEAVLILEEYWLNERYSFNILEYINLEI